MAIEDAPECAELFVCGRLCLLGEHSDWAGGFRCEDASIPVGRCLVVGTSDCGLHARVRLSPESPNTLTMTSVDDHGERRTRAFALDDPSALLREAQEGGFWCHVAGTCHHMVTSSPHAKSVATLARDAGVLLDNHRTTLPVKKGLSSSAAVCVLVARAFSRAFDLDLTVREEMSAAYAGERTTPSRCGRMDQACAFGPGRPVLLTFDGDTLDVEPLDRVAADVHIVVADLEASKDTVVILRDLQTAFVAGAGERAEPDPVGVRVRRLLGETNQKFVREATEAIERGDAAALGRTYADAQAAFDAAAEAACPSQLSAPALRATLSDDDVRAASLGGKGVGSQGDGSVQFVCDGEAGGEACAETLRRKFGLRPMRVVIRATSAVDGTDDG